MALLAGVAAAMKLPFQVQVGMTLADGFARLRSSGLYRQRFAREVPDWGARHGGDQEAAPVARSVCNRHAPGRGGAGAG